MQEFRSYWGRRWCLAGVVQRHAMHSENAVRPWFVLVTDRSTLTLLLFAERI